jgi:hypothetical protein
VPKCSECKSFFLIPEDALDYEEGVGDCVREIRDSMGKYWHTRKVKAEMDASECPGFKAK